MHKLARGARMHSTAIPVPRRSYTPPTRCQLIDRRQSPGPIRRGIHLPPCGACLACPETDRGVRRRKRRLYPGENHEHTFPMCRYQIAGSAAPPRDRCNRPNGLLVSLNLRQKRDGTDAKDCQQNKNPPKNQQKAQSWSASERIQAATSAKLIQ